MSVVPMACEFRIPADASTPHRSSRGFVNLVARVASWILREVLLRREMRRLAEFDDHMLRDIGIARADIEGAVRRGHDGSDRHALPSACLKPELVSLPTLTAWR